MKKIYLPKTNKRYPLSLRNCLDDFRKSWKDLDKLSKINEMWEELIGLELFNECKPLIIEKNILTIAVNRPEWRQALIYNKHRLKERIEKVGIKLKEIKIVQNYELKTSNNKIINAQSVWDKHPSRADKNKIVTCKFCNCPTPKGEISRWGKCTFCWRKNI